MNIMKQYNSLNFVADKKFAHTQVFLQLTAQIVFSAPTCFS